MVITSVEQLRAIDRSLGLSALLNRVPHYHFAIPELSPARNREASERLSNFRNACGCFAGGLFMGFTVIGFIASYLVSGRGISNFGIKDSLIFFGLFVVSTLTGKTFGVLWARVRAAQLVRRMTAQATAPGV